MTPRASPQNDASALRVLHFVSGGFSGATQVAIDLCAGEPGLQTLLVLRRKRRTPKHRLDLLRRDGITVETVPGWPHVLTVWRLARLCRQWQPDVLVAHGFSDHLWGRWAGLLAGVPHLVQVEHNVRERYGWWRLWQSRWLAEQTDALVGVSDAVRDALLRLGHPPARCVTIHNGIDLSRWSAARPWDEREDAVVMAARFARQKNHDAVIRAARELLDRGTPMRFYLAGGGSRRWRLRAERLAERLGVTAWVHFLGPVDDLPSFYGRVRYCVLSSHYEGLGLSLMEGMASGCCAIGSDVEGVREVIDHGRTGICVPPDDAKALADALTALRTDPDTARALARAGQGDVKMRFGRKQMQERYRELLVRLVSGDTPTDQAARRLHLKGG